MRWLRLYDRNLRKGQRAMAVARLSKLEDSFKQSAAADAAGVQESRISEARSVLRYAPELAEAVMAGTVPLSDAYAEARQHYSVGGLWRSWSTVRSSAAARARRVAGCARRRVVSSATMVRRVTPARSASSCWVRTRRSRQARSSYCWSCLTIDGGLGSIRRLPSPDRTE